MGNIFKRKKEIDTEFYQEWDEVEEFADEAPYEEDVELFEQEEYYETVEESEAQFSETTFEEEYYESEADEEYYEGEEYEDDAEDEYYEEEYYEDDEEEDEGGFLGGMSLVDKLITFGGAALAIIAVVIAGVFLLNPQEQAVSGDYLVVGNQLSDIDVIGESGLLAVAGQEQGRLQALEDALKTEDSGGQYNESEYSDQVSVGMTLTSIEKDLKIKFVNKNSGKLIGNVPFSVEVTDADGNTSMWSDDDMDGIIYKKKLTPGEYKVTAMALEGDKYDKYDLPQATTKTEVKSEIVIQKVDVSNEIKAESEIDVSKEDTAQKDTVVEEYLEDTVTWVESTVVEAAYEEVSKDDIKEPQLPVVSTGLLSLRRMFAGNVDNGIRTVTPPDASVTPAPSVEPSPSPTPLLTQGAISLDKSSVVLQKEKQATVKVKSIGGFLPDQPIAYTVSSSNGSVATASIDSNGTVTISSVADGEATITVVVNYAQGGTDATKATAQVYVKVAEPKIQLHILDMTVYATMKDTITVFITDAGVEEEEYKIEAISSDTNVATATVEGRTVTVTGVAEGTTDITVKYIEGEEFVSKVCKVTVLTHPMTDNKSKLVTSESGAQVYVLEGSEYREATYADYYTASKFYVLGKAKYTGWQTRNGKVYFYDVSGKKVTGEQVIQGVKYNFGSDGSIATGSGVMGIDVSKWNGNIDWKAVKNSGVSYVIIRCGYRGSTQGALIEDSKFKANMEGAIDAGLKVGVYFFTQAVDNAEALEEASMVLDLVKKYRISYPIFLDVESSGGRADSLSKEERTAICKTFCETIEKYGYTAGIYANKTWLTDKIDTSALRGYKIWLAQYASTPTYTGSYDLWQYKDTGKVSGINGNVDLNMSYLGY